MYTPQESHETQSTCAVITYHPILSNSPSTTLQLLSYSHFGCMALCLSFYLIFPSIPSSASFYSSSLLDILFFPSYAISWASLIAQLVKNLPAMQETRFDSWVRKIPWTRDRLPTPVFLGFPCGSAGKESACNARDLGLIPGLGRSPGEGKGYPLQ